MLNRQLIFDAVYVHALTQNKQAVSNGGQCKYRAADGSKCFIGFLIPDCNYTEKFEGTAIRNPDVQDAIGIRYGKSETSFLDTTFLEDLQRIHDQNPPCVWDFLLTRFADCYNLTVPNWSPSNETPTREETRDAVALA